MQFSMAITTISEGITPVRMVILNPNNPINPTVNIMLIATTISELATTLTDRKKAYKTRAATRIERKTNRKREGCAGDSF